MTKLNFDSVTISSKLIPRLEETVEVLKKIETKANGTSIPSGFNSSEYKDAVLKIKKAVVGLNNVKSDLQKAIKNFEQAETCSLKNVNGVNFDIKIDAVDAIVEIN